MIDTVDRQAVFNTVTEYRNQLREIFGDENELIRAVDIVKHRLIALPFVQSEIIRCRDCENWDTTWQNDFEPNYHYCPLVDGVRNADFYCADAERRKE